jgi:hypothetical protein
MKKSALISLNLGVFILAQSTFAVAGKKAKSVDLGLIKNRPQVDQNLTKSNKQSLAETYMGFMPVTDPSKREIARDRYTPLQELNWRTQSMLESQMSVKNPNVPNVQQQQVNQAMRSFSIIR